MCFKGNPSTSSSSASSFVQLDDEKANKKEIKQNSQSSIDIQRCCSSSSTDRNQSFLIDETAEEISPPTIQNKVFFKRPPDSSSSDSSGRTIDESEIPRSWSHKSKWTLNPSEDKEGDFRNIPKLMRFVSKFNHSDSANDKKEKSKTGEDHHHFDENLTPLNTTKDLPILGSPKPIQEVITIADEEDEKDDFPTEPTKQNLPHTFNANYLGKFSPVIQRVILVLQAFTDVFVPTIELSESDKDLVLVQQGRKVFDKEVLIFQLNEIYSKVVKFASLLPSFTNLHPDDKAALLENNVQLFLQYVLARYFSSISGLEQLSWILQDNVGNRLTEKVKMDLLQIRLTECASLNRLFYSSEFAQIYSDYCNDIGFLYRFSKKCNGLLAHVILFNTNGIDCLREPERIKLLFEDSKELLDIGKKYLNCSQANPTLNNVDPLLSSLRSMKKIFEDVCSK